MHIFDPLYWDISLTEKYNIYIKLNCMAHTCKCFQPWNWLISYFYSWQSVLIHRVLLMITLPFTSDHLLYNYVNSHLKGWFGWSSALKWERKYPLLSSFMMWYHSTIATILVLKPQAEHGLPLVLNILNKLYVNRQLRIDLTNWGIIGSPFCLTSGLVHSQNLMRCMFCLRHKR